ncbi:hypothetical protein WMY93_003123 [Mugilogobius chulae]|uniref:Uncharacterized protein n=1 Tax=Mugilogobius chulae TaxID=88201 RepID=A0AAW0PZ16_9GOBI
MWSAQTLILHACSPDHTRLEQNDLMNPLRISVGGLPMLASMAKTTDSRLRLKWRPIVAVLFSLAVVVLLFMHLTSSFQYKSSPTWNSPRRPNQETLYNDTYPLTPPEHTSQGTRYRIGVIADLDTSSLSSKKLTWFSYMRRGHLWFLRVGTK